MSINFIVQVESSEKSDSLKAELVASENSNVSENSPSEFVENCTTCLQQKLHEFTLPCKHSFCESCIVKWTENKVDPICPLCRFKLKYDNNLKVLLNERKQMHNLLRKACKNGDLGSLQVFIEKGAKLDNDLIHLVNMDRLDIYELLLKNGADVNALNLNNECLLYKACYKNDLELVKFLLLNDANPNVNNPLNAACGNGNLEIIKALIGKGANPNKKDDYGITSLKIACALGLIENVEVLLNAGAIIDEINEFGNTLLLIACGHDHLDIFKLLIDRGARLELDGYLIHFAVGAGSKKVVEYLILKKVNVNSVDKEGLTPLDLAYRRCDSCDNPYVAREIIDILIAHDAVRSKK